MKKIIYIVFGLSPFLSLGQIVNQETVFVNDGTIVSIGSSFHNSESGKFINDGTIYFYSHFTNDGEYGFSNKKKSSYAIFQPLEGVVKAQELKGNKESEFYDILFNNPTPIRAFELEKAIDIFGTANFTDGIVHIDSLNGQMVFHKGAKAINVSDNSHADGEIGKVGNEEFIFPKGDEQMHRFSAISAPANIRDSFFGKYYFKNSNSAQPHSSKTGVIDIINDKEYWTIERKAGDNHVILTLSWDERTTPSDLLKDDASSLSIVRWDSSQDLWVDEGGIVDIVNKTVTTPTNVKGYGVYTLATVKKNLILEGDVVIYNAVTPNGDGHNDYFIIDNIERYPNNTVEIYNRWGVKVYETKNYDSNDNVFRGYSEGRTTVNKGEKLPTGTYYYILNYEYNGKNGSQMIKRAGYLHLENN